jgi:hypothetical protein
MGAMTGSQVLMSDDSYTNIENVVTGSFLKIRNIIGLPDEGFKCGSLGWRLYSTSSLSVPSQSNVEVVQSWPDNYTDSYCVINGDKKFGTFSYFFTSGSDDKWKFKPTIELSVGDYLVGEDGQPLKITSVSVVSSSTQVFPINDLNVEPQDYFYANGVIMHNVDCSTALWSVNNAYSQYDEVHWPDVSYPDETCQFYMLRTSHPACGTHLPPNHEPSYNTTKGNVTSCNTDSYWASKGLCTMLQQAPP